MSKVVSLLSALRVIVTRVSPVAGTRESVGRKPPLVSGTGAGYAPPSGRSTAPFAGLLALLLVVSDAGATLIGDEVGFLRHFEGRDYATRNAFVQGGDGPEFREKGYTVDIDDAVIRFDTGSAIGRYGSGPHYFDIFDLDIGGPNGFIGGFSFVSSGVANVDERDVSFSGDSIRVDIADMVTTAGGFWEVRLVVDHVEPVVASSAVPGSPAGSRSVADATATSLPGTLSLILLSFLLLLLSKRTPGRQH